MFSSEYDKSSRSRMLKKKSPIWDFYKSTEGFRLAMCNSCGVSVSQRLLTQLTGFTTLEVCTLTLYQVSEVWGMRQKKHRKRFQVAIVVSEGNLHFMRALTNT